MLKQGNVVLEFQHLGTATATRKESDIAAWRKAVRTGAYPHTSTPPVQCALERRSPEGTTAWFANAYWLAGRVDSVGWEEDSLSLRINTKEPMAKAVLERTWRRIEFRNGELHCVFNPAPAPEVSHVREGQPGGGTL